MPPAVRHAVVDMAGLQILNGVLQPITNGRPAV